MILRGRLASRNRHTQTGPLGPESPIVHQVVSVYSSAAVTAVFVALLGWLLVETRDGSVLGLAERLTTSIQACWPFIIAVALRRTRHPRPGLAIGGSGRVKNGATARARARGRRQDR